jgi:hypothetical protein
MDKSNFFEKIELITERVQLVEDINLPESYNDYEDIKAKFFINIFTPLLDKNKQILETRPAPNNSKTPSIKGSEYQLSNYIILTIPRYILLNFKDKISAGTEFIITCIGEFKIEHFKIIGVYTL